MFSLIKTSRPTALSTENKKELTMAMIQTEEIKEYVLKISTLRKKIIKLYRIICGKCSPALQIELEGDSEYIKQYPTQNCLWVFTKVKMCTSGINYTSYAYNSEVMDLIQEGYNPT